MAAPLAPLPVRIKVNGMTCDHCVKAVTSALRNDLVDAAGTTGGISDVNVELVPGGNSTINFLSQNLLSEGDVRDALAEEGYELAAFEPSWLGF